MDEGYRWPDGDRAFQFSQACDFYVRVREVHRKTWVHEGKTFHSGEWLLKVHRVEDGTEFCNVRVTRRAALDKLQQQPARKEDDFAFSYDLRVHNGIDDRQLTGNLSFNSADALKNFGRMLGQLREVMLEVAD